MRLAAPIVVVDRLHPAIRALIENEVLSPALRFYFLALLDVLGSPSCEPQEMIELVAHVSFSDQFEYPRLDELTGGIGWESRARYGAAIIAEIVERMDRLRELNETS